MDLMEALRASVEQAKKSRAAREKPAAETRRRRKAS
jgi:non-homologous end joining protein Ku